MAAAALLAAASMPAGAVTFNWAILGSGTFNNPNNWSPVGTPTINDFVNFRVGSGNPYTVTFPGNPLVVGGGAASTNYFSSHLRVRDNGVSFKGSTQVGRTNSTYTVASPITTEADRGIIIGLLGDDNASLSLVPTGVFGGALTGLSGAAATLGDAVGAAGTLNVNVGTFNVYGSATAQPVLLVGNRGTGTIHVNGGADVEVTGLNSITSLGRYETGVGTVNISGAGSTWTSVDGLRIGEAGDGFLTVQNGGALITSGIGSSFGTPQSYIGALSGSNGTAIVSGPGSVWNNNSNLFVGFQGSGSLWISQGGLLLTNTDTIIGGNTGSTGNVTITGAGSIFQSSSGFQVGFSGAGTLSILDGGTVGTGTSTIQGVNAGSGHVTVGGAGSSWTVSGGPLTIGFPEPGTIAGAASLTVDPGGRVTVAGGAISLNSGGTVNLRGGTLEAAAILRNGNPFFFTGGTLTTNSFDGNLTNIGGTLASGIGVPGGTFFNGSYTQLADAALAIDIARPLFPGSFTERDFVAVNVFANLNGRLLLNLLDGYLPTGDQDPFTIVSANDLNGAFINVANGGRLDTVDGGGSFLVHYGPGSVFNPTEVVLSAFELGGDYNGSGAVEQGDLDLVLNNGGRNTATAGVPAGWIADLPSGAIDQAELDGVLNNRGVVAGLGGVVAAVSEPTAAGLRGLGLAAWPRRARRRAAGSGLGGCGGVLKTGWM